mgnify:FL=1
MNSKLMKETIEEIEIASLLLYANGIDIKELKLKDIKRAYALIK